MTCDTEEKALDAYTDYLEEIGAIYAQPTDIRWIEKCECWQLSNNYRVLGLIDGSGKWK